MTTQHKIPVGELVEVDVTGEPRDRIRLYVTEHRRDCDGTPLYALGTSEGSLLYGMPEDCLTVIQKEQEG